MAKRTLKRELNSVGQTIFVKNFSLFRKYYANEKNEHEKCKEELTEIKGGGESARGGANACCRAAREIFHQKKVREALQKTALSRYKHIPEEIKAQAQELLDNLPPEIE